MTRPRIARIFGDGSPTETRRKVGQGITTPGGRIFHTYFTFPGSGRGTGSEMTGLAYVSSFLSAATAA